MADLQNNILICIKIIISVCDKKIVALKYQISQSMTNLRCIILLGSLFGLLLQSCFTPKPSEQKKLTIAISKERKTEKKYSLWLQHQNIPFRFIDLSQYTGEDALTALDSCHALLLTGGNDVYPGRYGKESDTLRCGIFDQSRDSLEFAVFDRAVFLNMPVLGICRGMQLINVAQGGTLYIDLPEDFKSGETHRVGNEDWASHEIELIETGFLSTLSKNPNQQVASNHHQGIHQLGGGLKVSAICVADKLVEAIEWDDSQDREFMLAVQWHPEWMDYSDELSGRIAESFLREAIDYQLRNDVKVNGSTH